MYPNRRKWFRRYLFFFSGLSASIFCSVSAVVQKSLHWNVSDWVNWIFSIPSLRKRFVLSVPRGVQSFNSVLSSPLMQTLAERTGEVTPTTQVILYGDGVKMLRTVGKSTGLPSRFCICDAVKTVCRFHLVFAPTDCIYASIGNLDCAPSDPLVLPLELVPSRIVSYTEEFSPQVEDILNGGTNLPDGCPPLRLYDLLGITFSPAFVLFFSSSSSSSSCFSFSNSSIHSCLGYCAGDRKFLDPASNSTGATGALSCRTCPSKKERHLDLHLLDPKTEHYIESVQSRLSRMTVKEHRKRLIKMTGITAAKVCIFLLLHCILILIVWALECIQASVLF